jgi:tungstate transport system ATP-binding protein
MSDSSLVSIANANVMINDQRLLSDLSLHVTRGERVVILGPNGSGKTTLLRLTHGLVSANAGTVQTTSPKNQSFIFQRPVLLRRSVIDNIVFEVSARGMKANECITRANEAMDACGLSNFSTRDARSLSGGEQQRVALARAFAVSPELLLADEPTASLSPSATRDVEALLLKLHQRGCTLMMSSHNVAQARRMATRILFIDGGRIVEDADAATFFNAPRSVAAIDYLEGERI